MHQYQERDGEEDRQPGGHVKRMDRGHVLRRMLDAAVPRKRRRGRQTTRWTCQENGQRARAKKNVRCISTRKETERKTDNQVTCQEKGQRARTKKNVRCTSTRKETERKTDNQVDMSREWTEGTC